MVAATPHIEGHCDRRFAGLRSAFAENFHSLEELGAALSVMLEGEPVVDLWGGWMDQARTRPWQRETLVNVYSVGKPMVAVCLLMLAEQGRLDLDAPVAEHWPEFACAGKERITPRMLLAHRAGLPAIARPLPALCMYDWGRMTAALAAQEPWWQPDSGHGYHVNTFGFLIGELVRRVSGERVGAYFARTIARPLGADFHFGLHAGEEHRVAEFLTPEMPSGLAAADATNMVSLAYLNPPGVSGLDTVNTRAWRAAEIPSGNGHSNARAVARIYSALAAGGALDGVRVLGAQTIALATREASSGRDAVLDRPSRFGLGFQLTQPERPLGPNPHSFGHFGAGGALGFADPEHALAFGYTPNHGRGPRWQNPRNRALLDALYASL
ncbi:MAG TPA: serine hydrolase domain-containing protein [Solirubrobacteraceae bacterium]|nr:serine hydrolase domain-containing protein [Solirubrobacteraceae bacterium]